MVFLGLVTPCRRAMRPTSRSLVFETATTDGVVRAPSAFSRTRASPPCITATAEFVVPKSMPIIFPMVVVLFCKLLFIYVDRYLRRTDNIFSDTVAGPLHFFHCMVLFRSVGGRFAQSFVSAGVKRFPFGAELLYACRL